jgi:nitroreductase
MSEIGLFEAMYSARALRRLKPDPVPDEIITQILEAAIHAPSAGNSQPGCSSSSATRSCAISWRSSTVKVPISRRRSTRRACRPGHMTEEQYQCMMASGAYLWEHMGEAPVLLVPCLRNRPALPREMLPPEVQAIYDQEIVYTDRIRGASIYPAVQNIILACRALGLGTLITTNHIRCEGEIKALLGIPDDVWTYALMPIGYPEDKFGPVKRRPVNEVTYADRWGTAWPG